MRSQRLIGAIGLSLLVASCGGGGGSDAGGGGGGGTGFGGSSNDLLPAAPALGAELSADAAPLRPLRDGAVWSYRGVRQPSPAGTAVRYVTSTRHAASGSSGSVVETTSNGGNDGPESTTVILQAGRIGWTDRIGPFGTSAAENVEFVELRSPVRTGDQYTIHNRRYADGAGDVDSDGRADALDLVIYGRVIGTETVSLENLPSVDAVRVDLVSRARVVPSRTGVPGAPVETVVSTWYARGIGIVRQRLSAPNDAGTGTETIDETLSSFDGVSIGFGALQPFQQTTVPLDSPDLAGATLPQPRLLQSVLGAGNGAYALWGSPSAGSPSALLRMSDRGVVQWARSIPGSGNTVGTLLGNSSGLLLVVRQSAVDAIVTATRLDAEGRLIGTWGDVRFDLSGGRVSPFVESYSVDGDSSGIWVLWRRQFFDTTAGAVVREVVLRAYAPDGAPRSAEYVIDADDGELPSLAAGEGRALISWKRRTTHDLVSATATFTSLSSTQLLSSQVAPQNQPAPLPVHASGADALMWWWPIGGGTSSDRWRGVTVSPNGTFIRAGSTADAETIANWPTLTPGQNLTPIGVGSRIVGAQWSNERLWTTDEFTDLVTTVSWLDAGSGQALAGTRVNRTRSVSSITPGNNAGPAAFIVPLADRVLVLHADRFVSVVHWLNNGN